jgi:hypothetical protein
MRSPIANLVERMLEEKCSPEVIVKAMELLAEIMRKREKDRVRKEKSRNYAERKARYGK